MNKKLKAAIEFELGPQDRPATGCRSDWLEIEADVEKGMTLEEAVQKYLDAIYADRARYLEESRIKNAEFVAHDKDAQTAGLSPDLYKATCALAEYETRLKQHNFSKQKKVLTFDQWFDKFGAGPHESAIYKAMLHEAPVNAKAVEQYKIQLASGYVKRGKHYVYSVEQFRKENAGKTWI